MCQTKNIISTYCMCQIIKNYSISTYVSDKKNYVHLLYMSDKKMMSTYVSVLKSDVHLCVRKKIMSTYV
jgi:hypothetical protein